MRLSKFILIAIIAAIPFAPCSAQQPKAKLNSNDGSKPLDLPTNLIRDPFWPVGWAPKDWGKDADEAKKISGLRKWSSAKKQIKVTSISSSKGKYFAIIKGQKGLQEVGSIISVTHMGLVYRWKITDIKKTGIATAKLDVTPAK